jgi:uncharacterized protein (TIGR03437 family)
MQPAESDQHGRRRAAVLLRDQLEAISLKGLDLAPTGDSRIWASSDFVNNNITTVLDGVSVTVNAKPAFIYYISPTQINILTPPDALPEVLQVIVTNKGVTSNTFDVQALAISPSFFIFGAGPYLAATHATGALLGPATLYPGSTTPAKPGETITLYANGFGPTTNPVVSGAVSQSGTLTTSPVIKIGGATASVIFAGLVAPGEFQFNVVVPSTLADGDQPVMATYKGVSTQAGTLITVQH